MENKKYELLEEDGINRYSRTLYRIKALRDFGDVKKGDLGGYIEKEENLSQKGNCWVYNNAEVYINAKISGNAKVFDNAKVFGNAKVYGDAEVYGNAKVYGDAEVHIDAKVHGDTRIHNCANIFDHAEVYGNANIFGDARVHGDAKIYGNSEVYGCADVYGNAEVYGSAQTYGDVMLCSNADISSDNDYCIIKGFGSENRTTRFFRIRTDVDKYDIGVKCGCFIGNLEVFRQKVIETHGESKYAKEYLAAIEMVKIHFGL